MPSGERTAEIQMQSFDDGLPPPPPVRHSWRRIERWVEDNYQELFDNLCEGATINDVNELEHELDCSLPIDVRESLQVHDGQERGGRPTGVLFGCMLLDCEEIYDEWKNWRKVNDNYLAKEAHREVVVQLPIKAFAGPSSSTEPTVPVSQAKPDNTLWRDELLDRQESQPPNAVQKAYAHAGWIPLARDWGGNCIAVDLAPGPLGKWGQIIIFGRDYDCKFVIARSWAHFLAAVADDFGNGDKIFVDEESDQLKFLQFKAQGVEPPYLEVLRWRCDQRHGRRPPPRRRSAPAGAQGLRINSGVGGPAFDSMSVGSPYASPVSERGRSPQRFSQKPLPHPHKSSPRRPLERVNEEGGAPIQRVFTVDNNLSPPSSRQARELRKANSEPSTTVLTKFPSTGLANMTTVSPEPEPLDNKPLPEEPMESETEPSINGAIKESHHTSVDYSTEDSPLTGGVSLHNGDFTDKNQEAHKENQALNVKVHHPVTETEDNKGKKSLEEESVSGDTVVNSPATLVTEELKTIEI